MAAISCATIARHKAARKAKKAMCFSYAKDYLQSSMGDTRVPGRVPLNKSRTLRLIF
jgi:hypothetical protein